MKKIIYIYLIFLLPIFVNAQSKIIVIDPGHNFDDIASCHKTETEVMTNWAVANMLKEYIENYSFLDWQAKLTRPNNDPGNYVRLWQRAKIANDYEDDPFYSGKVYFLSIHCNAVGDDACNFSYTDAHGTESFYCHHTFNSNENLLTRYANNINDNIIEWGVMHDRDRCIEDSSWYGYHLGVLKNLKMPNCLNEIGFATNLEDESKLLDYRWREKFAWGYFQAFEETFADLNVINYSIVNLPCFGNQNSYAKINITLKNVSQENVNVQVRAKLRNFPMENYDTPTTDFCQLGTDKNVFLEPGEQTTITFDGDIPFTMDVGKALCIESRGYSELNWKKCPDPNHKKILKFPINGAIIRGVVKDYDFLPLQGAQVWIYQKPVNKSNKSSIYYSDVYDPNSCVSDKNGRYDLLVPYDWEEAVLSVQNFVYYDEISISPISDNFYNNYFSTNPVVIGVGSGSSTGGNVGTLDNPDLISGTLDRFKKLIINGQQDLAFVCKNKEIRFGILPRLYFSNWYGGYMLLYRCYIPDFLRYENCNWIGFNCDRNYHTKYFISIIKCDHNLNSIAEEKTKWFENITDEYRGNISISDIDLNQDLLEMGVDLQEGKIYKIKLAYLKDGDHGSWLEKSTYIYVLPENISYNNTSFNGNYYSANNIDVTNSIISSDVNLIAANKISILPNTKITGKFHASINPDIHDYSCFAKKTAEIFNNSTSDNSYSQMNSINREETEVMFNHRYVSKISNNCSCELKSKSKIINPTKNKEILIIPNPNNGNFTIQTENIKYPYNLVIYNSFGIIVYKSNNITERQNHVNLTNLSTGIYLVKLFCENDIYTKKVIIE